MRIQTAIAQTLAAQPSPTLPADTSTPLPTETPVPPTPRPKPTITPTHVVIIPSGPITITGMENVGSSTVQIDWQAEGSFVDGFKIVYSRKHPEPSYPDDLWVFIGTGSARSARVSIGQSDTYSFRVCEYIQNGDQCVNYSNVYQFTVE
jgi:hypothetical protein